MLPNASARGARWSMSAIRELAALIQAHPLVLRDLERFERFMSALQES